MFVASGPALGQQGIYAGDGGAVSTVISQTIDPFSSDPRRGFFAASINDAGDVAYGGSRTNFPDQPPPPDNSSNGYYLIEGTTITTIVEFDRSTSISHAPTINNAGQVAYSTKLAGAANFGVYRYENPGITTVMTGLGNSTRTSINSAGDLGAELHDVVDPLDIAFTETYPEDGLNLGVEPTTGTRYASFGYGVLNWGGEDQVRTVSQVDRLDPNFSPSPLGLPSTHTGGASGGPWLVNYAPGSPHAHHRNVVNGVNSYLYSGVDRVYSPQFDGLIHQFWSFAAKQHAGIPVSHSAIPEPSSLALLGLGCVAIAARRRRLRRQHAHRGL